MSECNRFRETFKHCQSDNEVHNKLVEIVCHDYLPYEDNKRSVERFRTKCLLFLNAPADLSAKTTEELLDRLRQKGKFGINNYVELRKLVDGVDADLPKIIDAATERIDKIRGRDQYMY